MATVSVLYPNNAIEVLLSGLKVNGAYVNNATVRCTLYQSDETTAVSGASNLAVSYVANSDGDYRGEIPGTISLTAGSLYWLKTTATIGGVQYAEWWNRCEVQRRTN